MAETRDGRERSTFSFPLLYLIALGLNVAIALIQTTTAKTVVPNVFTKYESLTLWVQIFTITVVIGKIAVEGFGNKRDLFFALGLIAAFARTVQMGGYTELIVTVALIVGARGIPYRRILVVYAAVSAPLIVIVNLAAVSGYIDNWSFQYWEDRAARQAFGFDYSNEYAAHIFFCFAAWAGARGKKITFFELAFFLAVDVFLGKYVMARTNMFCIAVLAIGMCLIKITDRIPKEQVSLLGKWFRICLALTPAVFVALFLVFTWKFNWSSEFFVKLNDVLSGRLRLGNEGMQYYGITLFGQQITLIGIAPETDYANYNFLDCSFINLMLRFGLVTFVEILLCHAKTIWNAVKKEDTVLLFLMALIFLQSGMEHHLAEIAYNAFLLLPFAVLPEES